MISGIYIIRNIINNNCYIGSAVNLNRRFLAHKTRLKNNTHHSIILQAAYNKHGADVFIYEILLYCEPEKLIFYEQRAINYYKPKYNVCQIAGSNLGYKHSTEAKIKMSNKRSRSGGCGDYTGGRHTQKHSEETKLKMAAVKLGNKNHLGHRHSEETKKKISDSLRRNKELLPIS
jgi:group I intron endonuclease